MFTSVLLDRILDDFAKFFEILIIDTRKLHFNLGFWNIIACAGWAHAEMISPLAKHRRKQFLCTLSLRWTNFHARSASIQILTVFTLPSNCMLSQWAETILSLAKHICIETISLLAEHMRKWFHRLLSQRRNGGCAADFSLLNLPKGKSLGRSKPATSS